MSKTTSHFALSPQGVPSRTKKQRPDPNRDFRAESHYGSAFFITTEASVVIIPSKLYVFGHIFGRSKSYRKALPLRCSSQLELSGTLSPISGLFYSGGGEKIHFQAQSACNTKTTQKENPIYIADIYCQLPATPRQVPHK